MDEVISGQKAIIVQGMQEEVIHSFVAQNDRVRSATFKGRAFSGLLFPIMNGMSLINTAIVIFAGSAILLNDSNIEAAVAIGLITTYAQFSQQYYQPIIQIAASWGSLQLAFTGADRIQEMFDASEEIRPENAPAFTELKDAVEIKHVNFSYVEGKPILKDVSILAPKGKMTAVVGRMLARKWSKLLRVRPIFMTILKVCLTNTIPSWMMTRIYSQLGRNS